MKRIFSLLAALLLVLSMIPAVSFAAGEVTVYWDPVNGADSNNGLSETAPVKTAAAAYAALDGAEEGTLVLLDTLELTAQTTFPACDIPVTVTSKTGAEGIKSGANVLFNGPTTLENLTLTMTAASNSTFITAEGHDLSVGQNITCIPHTSGSTKYYFCLSGRYSAGSVDGLKFTVQSGTWRNIYCSSYKNAVTGDASLTVTGGTVINNIAPSYTGSITGNVDMFLSGVTVQTNICGTSSGAGKVTGNVNITVLDGVNATNLKPTKCGSGNVTGKVTVTVDGDCSNIENIIYGTYTGTPGSTALVLKSGVLACDPCTFDTVTVDVAADKTLTLDGCAVSADTVTATGGLIFRGSASLSAAAVTGSVACQIDGKVLMNHVYVSAPADAAIRFPDSTGITGDQGQWAKRGAFDEDNFEGLVITAASDVTVSLYTGYTNGSVVTPNYVSKGETNAYYYAGITGKYRYIASGDGYYTVTRNIYMSEEEAAVKTVVDATPGKMAGNGTDNWETTDVSIFTDEAMALSQDDTLSQWPEYADVFTTPYFTENHAQHQMTTQAQTEAFLQKLDGADDNMYILSAGSSTGYSYDIPAVFFTQTDLSEATTVEEAAALMGQDKPTVLYRAQIHGNEPAAGEAALAMVQRLDGAYGDGLLENINICILPRANPDGARNYDRLLANGVDPNRDMLRVKTQEIADFLKLYQALEPELIIDGHEYNVSAGANYVSDGDMLIGAGFTNSNTDAFTQISKDIMSGAFAALVDNGLNYRYYSNLLNTSDSNISRGYAGQQGTLFFLLETRGIGYGLSAYARRIISHIISVEYILDYTAENAEQVQQTTGDQRKEIIHNGATYEESDVVILSTTTSTPAELNFQLRYVYQDGTVSYVTNTPKVSDQIVRSRVAPTAYVIPAGESYTEKVLALMDKQGISYSFIPAGSTALLQQYTGTTTEAGLTDEKQVTFENGAYVFCKNQVRGITLSMLMEPDVTDVNTYKGTLAQQGILTASNGKFPIYRYIHDLNEAGMIDYTAPAQKPGDFTGDGEVTNEDVVYLLWHTLYPEEYAITTDADFNDDGNVTNEDVVYLLWHTLYPTEYPLTYQGL